MSFLLSVLAVVSAFFVPILLASRRGRRDIVPDCFGLAVPMAVFTFIAIQMLTMKSSEKHLSLSEVDYATVEVEGEKTLYVKHPKGEFQTGKATLINNIEDTSQVEIVLTRNESVWFGTSHGIFVRSK